MADKIVTIFTKFSGMTSLLIIRGEALMEYVAQILKLRWPTILRVWAGVTTFGFIVATFRMRRHYQIGLQRVVDIERAKAELKLNQSELKLLADQKHSHEQHHEETTRVDDLLAEELEALIAMGRKVIFLQTALLYMDGP